MLIVINSGSTSVKLAAYEADEGTVPRGVAKEQHGDVTDAHGVLGGFLSRIDASRVTAVAHRIVHGGTRLVRPLIIDAAVESEIAALSALAPLHNPIALHWIAEARKLCRQEVVQLGAFDTAFFARLPRVAAEYAIPPSLAAEHGVRRYGFHGLAHEALWRRWCELRPQLAGGGRLITLQLGGGSSISAVDGGHARDTSMGFSPLEGLVMATRSGDIDPAVVPYLERRLGVSSDRVLAILNRESGLLGLSGSSVDMSALVASAEERAQFAVELYCYRARKYVGAFLAALGGCDGIVFGGGIGEHVPRVRELILQDLEWAGIAIDRDANERTSGEARISLETSRVGVYVVAVDEEQVLARAALECLARNNW